AYGNSSVVGSPSNPVDTWANNYQAVYHFGDGSTLSVTDSTSKTTPTNGSATATTGEIYGGVSVGTSKYVDFNSAMVLASEACTFGGWFNTAGGTTFMTRGAVSSSVGWSFSLEMDSSGKPIAHVVTTSGGAAQYDALGST